MALTYEQFADLILENTAGYEIVEFKNGREHHYRGRDISAFFSRTDSRLHEHKAFKDGQLVYHRDANGVVRVGTKGQEIAAGNTRSLGSLLLYGVRGKSPGMWSDAAKRGIRWGLGGRR